MSRAVALPLVAVSVFFLLLVLTPGKPGLPTHLKADEAAYYLMALSLVRDGDLRLDVEDVDRLFVEFPFQPVRNLVVMTHDGWETVLYGKPLLYPLFAAPFAGLFGANGLLFFNMALFLGMIWLGTLYLACFNSSGTAALFSAGFFFLSVGFSYVFWLQTEVFNMASVTVACFLLLYRTAKKLGPSASWAALSGAALAPAVSSRPMFLLLALPLVWTAWRQSGRSAVAWVGGLVLALLATAGLSQALSGTPSAYLGSQQRTGVTVCEPRKMPIEPVETEVGAPTSGRMEARAAAASTTGNTFSWLYRVPDLNLRALSESTSYFFVGRHTGLLLYMPFAGLAVLLLFFDGKGSSTRWGLLLSLAVLALWFLLFIPQNWQGGGGFLGNRYFVNVYPVFLFLVRSIRPSGLVVPFYALGGLFLGPLLLSPWSPTGPEPTLQAHVRNAPFRHFPLELSLRHLPGYHRGRLADMRYYARRDQVVPSGSRFWMRGADRVEIQLISAERLGPMVFDVRSFAAHNAVSVRFGEGHASPEEGAGRERFTIDPVAPQRVLARAGGHLYVYELVVETTNGAVRRRVRHYPPNRCSYFAFPESSEESFFVGAEVTLLGSPGALDEDVFAVVWGSVEAPGEVVAGELFRVPTEVRNRSQGTWDSRSLTPVMLSYHWLDAEGAVAERDGLRTPFPTPVEPGRESRVGVQVRAPTVPGDYVLEIDPVFENVAWFSERNDGRTSRHPVRVVGSAP